MESPLILITISYIIGILIGWVFIYFPFSTALLILLGCVLCFFLIKAGRYPLSQTLLAAAFILIGAGLYIYSSAYLPKNHYLRLLEQDNSSHIVIGKIASPLERDPGRTAFVLELKKLNGTDASGRLRVNVRDEVHHIGYGDVIEIKGRIFAPQGFRNPGGFDYPAFLARQGIYRTISVKEGFSIHVHEQGKGVFRYIQDLRERIRKIFISSTQGPGSSILMAMVLGEEGGLTDEIREKFMAAGVTHILSISGSHLGLVAVLSFGLIRWMLFLLPERTYHRVTLYMDPKKIAAILTVVPVTFYAFLAGAQTATMRSLIMILSAISAVIFNREGKLMHSLAAAALVILIINPQALFDISFQLSYISVLAVGYVVLLWSEIRKSETGSIRKLIDSIILLIAISVSTGLATGPIVAFYFNQVSLIGVFSNVIVVPFAGFVVVPLGLSTGVLSLFTNFLPLASINQAASDIFYNIVKLFAGIPYAELRLPAPSVIFLFGYFMLVLSLALFISARLLYISKPLEYTAGMPRRYIIGIIAGGAILIMSFSLHLFAPNHTRVTFIDVGQGDSCLIELSSKKRILIDGGGTYDNRFDIGKRVLAPFLWNRGIRQIDLVILSHPHPDHMNGLTYILRSFRVSEIWISGHDMHLPGCAEFMDAAAKSGASIRMVSTMDGMHQIGGAMLTILHPAPDFRPAGRRPYQRENSRSLVIRADIAGKCFLFTGDIEADAETAILNSWADISCSVLKVPHHGSRSSSTPAFIAGTSPEIVVISAGARNWYGHPHPDVVAGWEGAGSRVYRTDRDGAVSIRISNGSLTITTWSELILERVQLDNNSDWKNIETKNYMRLFRRIMEPVI